MRLTAALSSWRTLRKERWRQLRGSWPTYLVGTLKKRLTAVRNGATEWTMYSDSDHAGDRVVNGSRSVTGVMFVCNGEILFSFDSDGGVRGTRGVHVASVGAFCLCALCTRCAPDVDMTTQVGPSPTLSVTISSIR